MVIIISTEGIMGRIKSAWEIALERTENIEVDAEKIRHSANIEAIPTATLTTALSSRSGL